MVKYGKHWALVGCMLAGSPSFAECRLALLLALDVSSSVDASEDDLQRQGLARALVSDQVVDAFLSVPGTTVALGVYEWSGRYQQTVVLPWMQIDTAADLQKASNVIAGSGREFMEFPTAIGYSLGYASSMFAKAPKCWAQTLDVSGDGRNNEGFKPKLAYRNFPLRDVTVNALTIGGQEDRLAEYYREELIKGPGSFVLEAQDFQDFERAMGMKLVKETSAIAISQMLHHP